jgi:ribonuclease HI
MEETLEAYTDGSCLPSPRRGGIGIRFVAVDDATGDEVTEDLSPPGYKGATNQEMELLACTKAFQEALQLDLPASVRRLVIRTDSSYLHDNYKRAIFEWPKQKWLTRSGAPVENAEDWRELVRWFKKASERFEVVRIDWVKGHSRNPHNKAAHQLAAQSAKRAFNRPRKVVHVRRKKSEDTVSRGSVLMQGQTMTIRVTQSGILNVQKLWRCTYEVASTDSPFEGRRDVIICERGIRLDAGHTYQVRVNGDNRNPRVVEVLTEVAEAAEEEVDIQEGD